MFFIVRGRLVIKSLNYDQHEILSDILKLNGLDRFQCDLTYGNGSFYKKIPEPLLKYDIDPQFNDVSPNSSTSTGLPDECLKSLIFDPPFLTYVKQGRGHGSIMSKRFGGYWSYDDLKNHYVGTINEAFRILNRKGLMVVKCQDIIHNHKMHATHINFINWCDGKFRIKDLFVLGAKNRMKVNNGKQQHARIYHCYFLVMERLK